MRVESREDLRTETDRLIDVLTAHGHDADGQVVFRIPPTADD